MAAIPPSANDTSHRGSQQDLGPIDQLNNLPQKLHDLEWNIVAFAPVSSITLCAKHYFRSIRHIFLMYTTRDHMASPADA